MGEVAVGVLSDPTAVVDALATTQNLTYLAWTIAPLFLAVLAPRLLAVGVPITVVNLVSSFSYQHEARRHSTVYFITIVALAAVVGALRLARDGPSSRLVGVPIATMIVAALVSSAWIGPTAGRGGSWNGRVPMDRVDDIEHALTLIPPDAGLAADTFVATRLAHRTTVDRLPTPWTRHDWGTSTTPDLPPTTTVEWIAVLKPAAATNDAVESALSHILAGDDFTLRYEDDLLIVLQR